MICGECDGREIVSSFSPFNDLLGFCIVPRSTCPRLPPYITDWMNGNGAGKGTSLINRDSIHHYRADLPNRFVSGLLILDF